MMTRRGGGGGAWAAVSGEETALSLEADELAAVLMPAALSGELAAG
jgi:hypothetical protein